jgi:LPS export ABC transporter protein LptC
VKREAQGRGSAGARVVTGSHGASVRRCLRASVPRCARALVPAILLAACGAPERNVAAAGTAADSADQTMFGLSQILTKGGVNQAYLQADTAFMYETSGRVDLRHVKVTFYSAQGDQQSVLTGKEGTYWTRTNQMSARGSVLVVRSADQARLRTEFLEYDPAKNQVRTDQPYVADKREQHFEGVGFVCDPGFTDCTTRQAKGNAGNLVMPAR